MSAPLRVAAAIVAALLALIVLSFFTRVPDGAMLHGAMLVGFAIACATRRPLVVVLAVVVVLMALYQSIAEPAFLMMGRSFDSNLAAIDRTLFFGREPALMVANLAARGSVEFFSLVYGWFIPYLWLSILLGCLGRPAGERDAFILGLSITYAAAYLGYLFLPSRGPVEWYHFAASLPGGPLHDMVLQSVEATGGNHGAFPSLHVGASAYLCLFDLRRNPLRGMTYLPMVVLITFSTILLRYHYVFDVVVGLGIAFCAHVAVMAPAGGRRDGRRAGGAPNALRILGRAGVKLFFDRVEIDGLENVPKSGPLIVVSNHTNGLVDGLMLLAALPRDASLTAKSTLKKDPLLALLMRIGGVVPFYRRQDNVDMTKNVDSFASIKERLARGESICIFPEGVSHSDASMRELKSGAARLANETNTPILPVGLHYDAKQRFRSSVLVRIGAPLPGSSSTHDIENAIRALTTNFRRVREALWLRWTAELLETRGDDPKPLDQETHSVAARARLIDELRTRYEAADRDRVASIFGALRGYRRELRRRGIAQHEVYLSLHPLQAAFFVVRELELLVVGGAIVAVALVQHGLAIVADRLLTKKLSTDLDHWASNAIFYGFAIFPLTWIACLALAWTLGSPLWALAYAIALPFTLLYTAMWWPRAAGAVRRARTFLHFLFRREQQRDLQQRGRAIIEAIEAT